MVVAVKTKAQRGRQIAAIRRVRGMLKRRPCAEEWAEHKREELALEEAKFLRSTGGAR